MKSHEEIRLKAPARIDLGLNAFWNKRTGKYDTLNMTLLGLCKVLHFLMML